MKSPMFNDGKNQRFNWPLYQPMIYIKKQPSIYLLINQNIEIKKR
jgi:hypothetical protein